MTPPNSYGDVVTHNNAERLYVIGMEIVSAITFATIIAAITSVVTSMDMNGNASPPDDVVELLAMLFEKSHL